MHQELEVSVLFSLGEILEFETGRPRERYTFDEYFARSV